MARRNAPQLAYDALAVEGALFNAEWLARVAHLEAPRQRPEDYGIPDGLQLRDEIARAFRIAQALWARFAQARSTEGTDPRAATERFVTALLQQALGFTELARESTPRVLAERSYPVSHGAGRVPVVIAASTEDLDAGAPRYGDGGRRRSPFGLLQEYLNAAEESLWGLACNGLRLRLARDNASLTRPAWFEADLERLFSDESFADFSVLWLTVHASRFGAAAALPHDCALEDWRTAGQATGLRARDALRRGVEEAVLTLGQGFLSANPALRTRLVAGELDAQGYFQQLLRLVYRVIFLLTVEERGLLHPPGSDADAVRLYERGYGLRRLRERAVRHSAHDTHRDLYEGLKVVFRALATGEPRLALPPLGGLFAPAQTPALDGAVLANRHLAGAVWSLAWMARDGATERVNWRDMGPEELGSVYESLLELVPQVTEASSRFGFAGGDATRGNARKLSGSYYTPDSLVQALLDSALEPVIARTMAANPGSEAAALLRLRIIDPAVGSGHFLLAAARRLAGHLARARAEGQPGAREHRNALRDVVTHCLFGVDRNPMALELARIALWLEAMTPEAPLGFLDAHLVRGDALLGVLDPAVLSQGIPDDAFKALSGDAAEVCNRLKQRNRAARRTLEQLAGRGGQLLLDIVQDSAAAALADLDAMPDGSLEEVAAKQAAYAALQQQLGKAGLAEDLLLAAYLMPKRADTEHASPTTEHLMRALTGQPVDAGVVAAARQVAHAHAVFHWRDAFAQVFAQGGFDCVVGNPPWERIKLQEQEFFAERAPEVAAARNAAARSRAIAALGEASAGTPERRLFEDFQMAKRTAEAASAFMHDGVRYSLTGRGDVNTYALFAETAVAITAPTGRAGIIVPSGISTDDSTKVFFSYIAETGRLVALFSFENEEMIFPGVHHWMKFSLLVTTGGSATVVQSHFVNFARQAAYLSDINRRFTLSPADFQIFNPNTRTCPVFRSQKDAELTKRIYARVPVLWDEGDPEGNPWGLSFSTLFHMSGDSGLFRRASMWNELADPVPLYEAKMIHQFDHRWATYAGVAAPVTQAGSATTDDDGADEDRSSDSRDASEAEKADPRFAATPRYWVERSEVQSRLAAKCWTRGWMMGWRDITNTTNERTVIAGVVPRAAVGHTMPLLFSSLRTGAGTIEYQSVSKHLLLLANLNSMPLDYIARLKIGGTHLTYTYLKQFPVVPPSSFTNADAEYIVPRVLELIFTADDLQPLYDDVVAEDPRLDPRTGPDRGRPFPWNPERRAQLRAELDACYARLYGLTRDELRYILDPADLMGPDYPSETFRVLKEKEIRHFGEYRTRRLVLEAWDRLHG